MRLLIIMVLLIVSATARPQSSWETFKAKYNKAYANPEEEIRRKAIWEKACAYIDNHNAEAALGKHSYTLGENKYADIAPDEFQSLMNGYRLSSNTEESALSSGEIENTSIPDSVDWRTAGIVSPVVDQGQCGDCWVYSAVDAVEGEWALYTGTLVPLSYQNVIDCVSPFGGCEGGTVSNVFDYIMKNGGIDTEVSYANSSSYRRCHYNASGKGAEISSYAQVECGSELALKRAVASVGLISVGIDASEWAFQLYSGGIYNPRKCSSTSLDHAALLVGYGSSEGTDFWIVKNSWGTSWGVDGYVYMIRNDNNKCGIATEALYPIV